jgi:hypothetical protein
VSRPAMALNSDDIYNLSQILSTLARIIDNVLTFIDSLRQKSQ